jgi:hypothetical protein
MNNSIKKSIFPALFLVAAIVCALPHHIMAQSQDSIMIKNESPVNTMSLSFAIIPAASSTWCYDIYEEGRLLIHQPSIPALPGNVGFSTKEDAEKVARLVIEKIIKGEMPPTMTIEELDSLKVQHRMN